MHNKEGPNLATLGFKIQSITFDIEGETYGIDILSLDEIIEMVAIKPIPQAPEFLEGVLNLRGEIIPVIDMRKQFGLLKEEYTYDTRIIMASFDSRKVGFIIEGVRQVIDLDRTMIQKPVLDFQHARFIGGIARLENGKMMQLIMIDKVLDKEQLKILSKINISTK